MKIKKLFAAILVLCMTVALLTGCGSSSTDVSAAAPATAPAAEPAEAPADTAIAPVTLQIGHVDVPNPDNHNQFFATKFAEKCAEYSDGAIEIQIMGNSQLGAERDMMEGMQMGTVDMAIITNLAIGNFDSEFQIYDLPYLFNDSAEAFSLIDSEIGQKIGEGLYDKVGIKVLATAQGGFRQTINSKHPIETVSDFSSLKLRVPENDTYMACFKALGANATPLAWNECFTGLQQGSIDGLECPLSVIYTTGFAEAAGYLSITNHIFSPVVMMISGSVWDTLDEAQQEIISKAAKEAALEQRAFIDENDQSIIGKLEDAGMETSYVDMEEASSVVSATWEAFKANIGAEVFDSTMAFLGK